MFPPTIVVEKPGVKRRSLARFALLYFAVLGLDWSEGKEVT